MVTREKCKARFKKENKHTQNTLKPKINLAKRAARRERKVRNARRRLGPPQESAAFFRACELVNLLLLKS